MPVTVTGGRAAKKKTSKKSAAKKKAEQAVTATADGELKVNIDETAADASTDGTHEAVSESANVSAEDGASSEAKRKRTSRKEKNLPEYPNVSPEDVINVVCQGIAQGMTEMTAEFLCEKLDWPTDPEALSALRQRYTNYRNGTKDSAGLGDDLPPLAHRPRGAAAAKIDFEALRAKLKAAKGQ